MLTIPSVHSVARTLATNIRIIMGLRPRRPLPRQGVFNPHDATRIKHTRIGVWDLYEEKHSDIPIPGASRLETASHMLQGLPYVWRMLKDICSVQRCLVLMFLFLAVEVATSLIPAVSLWSVSHPGRVLTFFSFFPGILDSFSCWYGSLHLYPIALFDVPQVETAVEKRTVDKDVLLHVAAGRVACTIAERLLQYSRYHISRPLNLAIKQFYSTHIFHAMARLDLPTFEDPAIQRQLEGAWSTSWKSTVAWDTIQLTSSVIMTMIRLLSQISVLISVLKHQQDGTLLALLSFSQSLFQWFSGSHSTFNSLGDFSVSYLVISCLHTCHMVSVGCNDQRQGLHPNAGLQAPCGQPCTPQRSRCRLPRRALDETYAFYCNNSASLSLITTSIPGDR